MPVNPFSIVAPFDEHDAVDPQSDRPALSLGPHPVTSPRLPGERSLGNPPVATVVLEQSHPPQASQPRRIAARTALHSDIEVVASSLHRCHRGLYRHVTHVVRARERLAPSVTHGAHLAGDLVAAPLPSACCELRDPSPFVLFTGEVYSIVGTAPNLEIVYERHAGTNAVRARQFHPYLIHGTSTRTRDGEHQLSPAPSLEDHGGATHYLMGDCISSVDTGMHAGRRRRHHACPHCLPGHDQGREGRFVPLVVEVGSSVEGLAERAHRTTRLDA
ncbi:MAG: hypothetical protein BWY85_02370 [Firmicutes bacterium ADurb.Bin506]|nr:MAG: hypothetical protein BWY85_02370 [Firmicutes bacterium ADurb.Bin506]